jgi:hypothetical protein
MVLNKRFKLGASPVQTGKQKNSDHVDEMPVSSCSFKTDMVLPGEVIVITPSKGYG